MLTSLLYCLAGIGAFALLRALLKGIPLAFRASGIRAVHFTATFHEDEKSSKSLRSRRTQHDCLEVSPCQNFFVPSD